jgi:uncharacterized protein YggE
MLQSTKTHLIAAMLLGLVTATLGNAQEISVRGTSTSKLVPTVMRMRIILEEKEKSASAAVEKLVERRDAAIARLKKLGAISDGVSSTRPSFSHANQADQDGIQRAMVVQLRGQPQPDPEPITRVQCVVEASWRIDDDDADEAFRYIAELQEAIRLSDLGGINEYQQVSPTSTTRVRVSSSRMVVTRTPMYGYVAQLDAMTRQSGMKAAFEEAETQARELAIASGRELGELLTVSSTRPRAKLTVYDQLMGSRISSLENGGSLGKWRRSTNEFIFSSYDTIEIEFGVTATFDAR